MPRPIIDPADPHLTAAAGTEPLRFDIDLPKLLAPHDMLWSAPLPSHWIYGAPIGNGEFGAVLYGPPYDLRLALARPDVWDRQNDGTDWYPGASFEDIRRCYRDNDREALKRIWEETAARKPIDMPHLTTCGTLRLGIDEGLNPAGAQMAVRLADGLAEMTWEDRRLTALASREYDVLLLRIDGGEGRTDPDPRVDCYGRRLPSDELPWELHRPPLDNNPKPETACDQATALLTQRFNAGGSYTVGVRMLGFGAHECQQITGRIAGRAHQPAGREVHVLVAVVSDAEHGDPAAECRRRLDAAEAAGAEAILDAHRRWWRRYWSRGLVAVGAPAVETWYYRSLYICGSMLRPGRQLPGLQGVWCGENNPPWYGDYHANINVQANVWGLYANNRLELIEPYLRLYCQFADNARRVAGDYYKMRGLKFPHAGSITGHEMTSPLHSRLSLDPCESAWLAGLFWDYWRYSGDDAFGRDVAYPILRDVGLLLADYLTWDEQTGRYSMGPMVHFEANATEWEGWAENTLYGQAFFGMGFAQAIAAADRLGVDAELRELWAERLARLGHPPVGEDGAWQPMEGRSVGYEGHSFMLPLVFPAERVSAVHGPADWQKQAQATWQKLRDGAEPTRSGGAWCGGQGICEVLRLGDAEHAFAEAAWKGGCPNGFNIRDDATESFMQADHVAGMCRVAAELCLLETGDVVHLFYGVPEGVPARFYSLRAPGGFLLSAERRIAAVDYVAVQATRDGTLNLARPWPGPAVVRIDGREGSLPVDEGETGAGVVRLDLAAGQTATLFAQGRPPETLSREGFALQP